MDENISFSRRGPQWLVSAIVLSDTRMGRHHRLISVEPDPRPTSIAELIRPIGHRASQPSCHHGHSREAGRRTRQ